MEAELSALAVSGATALVGAMVDDAWTRAKSVMAGILGRGDRGEQASAEAELEASRSELERAADRGDGSVPADVEAVWRMRLRLLLREDPSAAGALRRFLDEVAPAESPGPAVRNDISGGTVHGHVVQGRDFSGSITLGAAPPSEGSGPVAGPGG